jgi:ATP synthase protein I
VWRQFRPIFGLQILSTAAVTLLSAWLAGKHGAISAALGGSIGIAAGLIFVAVASRSKAKSAGEALYAALRAELIKLALMIFSLWLVFETYNDLVMVGLMGSFIASLLIFAMAGFVKET